MSASIEFGTLEDVEARLAWAHEAHIFTPWLAENLDRLSAAIGVEMELTGTEVGVGRYSADILARDVQEGRIVLIENQLEWSDHNHLGQILTYLAGTDAQIIVWLAPSFRDEHLSAVRWLNQHSHDDFSFFAVRLRVVRIGDSPYAPLFDVLEKPNSWDRSVQRKVKTTATPAQSNAVARQRAFWARYAELYPDIDDDMRAGGAAARWRAVGDTGVVVSRYVSKENVGIFYRGLRGSDGPAIMPLLEPHVAELETALGIRLGSEQFPFCKTYPLAEAELAGPMAAIDWLEAETDRYIDAASRLLQREDA